MGQAAILSQCPTGSFFFNIGSRQALKKIQVGFESGRSVKINNSLLLGTLFTLGFPGIKDISGYLAVKWGIVHIL